MAGKFEFNPWLKIFTKPRNVIRQIVDFNPNFRLFPLAFIYGFCAFLGLAQNMGLGRYEKFWAFLPFLLLAPLWGYIVFSVSSFFVFLTGKLLKGQGSFKQIRSAYAWSSVPLIVNAAVWILLMLVFGSGLFYSAALQNSLTSKTSWFLIGSVFLQLVFSVWSIVIYVISLSEVQRFSILRTLVNIVLSLLFFAALALLVSLLLVKTGVVSA